jgi:hypothetical protein
MVGAMRLPRRRSRESGGGVIGRSESAPAFLRGDRARIRRYGYNKITDLGVSAWSCDWPGELQQCCGPESNVLDELEGA